MAPAIFLHMADVTLACPSPQSAPHGHNILYQRCMNYCSWHHLDTYLWPKGLNIRLVSANNAQKPYHLSMALHGSQTAVCGYWHTSQACMRSICVHTVYLHTHGISSYTTHATACFKLWAWAPILDSCSVAWSSHELSTGQHQHFFPNLRNHIALVWKQSSLSNDT